MLTPGALVDAVPTWLPRAAHDVGLAAWFGGAYMGAIALNGASREVEDPTQRGRVATAGWFRWAAVVPVAVGLHLGGGVMLTRRQPVPTPSQHAVAVGRTALLGGALVATVASGHYGRRLGRAGDVPAAAALTPINDTPPEVASAMRTLRVLQWVVPAATGAILVVDAWQQSHGGTRLRARQTVPQRAGGRLRAALGG